jgi:hypothetical protein
VKQVGFMRMWPDQAGLFMLLVVVFQRLNRLWSHGAECGLESSSVGALVFTSFYGGGIS